jgi:signal transduction histidine kinase/DNA-binding response OmpR family regulator
MISTERIKQGRIKPKVFFGFFIILSIAAAALLVTYKGFIELTETKQSLTGPSTKLIKLNSILTDIYEAESNIRTYTLTQNETYLSIYLSFMHNINDKVDSLLVLAYPDPIQGEKIRFIQELLSRKQRVLNELVSLKRNDQTSRFYQQALEQVEMISLDSIKESSVITSVTTTKTSRRDSVISKPSEEESLGGFSRFFRWFAKKDPTTDSTITKLIVEVETQIDTLKRSVISPSDSLLNEVVKILTKIQTQQEMSLYNISAKELEILKSDKEIMDQIRTVVSLLEREELMNSITLAEEVESAVESSTRFLLMLGGAAFLMVILFTTLIFRDVSKANFYRNKLLHAKQYAEKLLKIKEEFLSNMNHEIRTPLSAIVGLSKQLQKTKLDKQDKFLVDSLNTSSQHLLHIVNDILDLSKIEGGYLKFEKVPFNPMDLTAEAVETFTPKAQEKGIDLNLIRGNFEPLLSGDPLRFKQILFNLIGNAIKFTPSGKVDVFVDCKEKANGAIECNLKVSDTGIGIPSDKLETIFEQFSQVDSSTTRLYGGTGLGLAIVKKLVELQNGAVKVESAYGQGAVFTVLIEYPLSKEIVSPTSGYHTVTPKLSKDLKIVVVDDDPISQLLVKEMLKFLGVTPKVYSNPFDALESISLDPPAIVLTDIQMPIMSGLDLVKKINALNLSTNPKVIALTANSTANKEKFYYEAGFSSALTKPFNEFDLYNVIAPLVGLDAISNLKTLSAERLDGYDISEIRRFAADDDDSTCEILQSFIDNSKANVKYLKMFVKQQNWKGIGEVAHKMKSAFRQLKVNKIALLLEELEGMDQINVNQERLNSLVNDITASVQQVQELLKMDIDKIKVKA